MLLSEEPNMQLLAFPQHTHAHIHTPTRRAVSNAGSDGGRGGVGGHLGQGGCDIFFHCFF